MSISESISLADRIVRDLHEFNMVIKTIANTGSCYICSTIVGVHQIRVADHRGKGYAYKWEIRPDVQTQTGVGQYKRNFYNSNDYDAFIQHFKNYYNTFITKQCTNNPFEDKMDAPLDITHYNNSNYSSDYK